MNTWTAGAKAELEKYLAAIRRPLEQAGADAVEVIEDLKRHIEADVAAARLRVVTVGDLRPMLDRIGRPGACAEDGEAVEMNSFTALDRDDPIETTRRESEGESSPAAPRPPQKPGWALLICGVIYPFIVLLFEWTTGFCAKHFFNPIPTFGHVLLVALVPAVNGYIWHHLRQARAFRFPRAIAWLASLALGISTIYSAVFLPLLLPSLLTLVFFGLGLLPLAPVISAGATAIFRNRLKQTLARRVPGIFSGCTLAALALLLIDIRHISTTVGLEFAKNEPKSRWISWLRTLGSEQSLRDACYQSGANFGSVLPLLFAVLPKEAEISPEQAQRVYFQVYGRAYNAAPAPRRIEAWFDTPNLLGRAVDRERGRDKVGATVPGLSLRTSRLDATVEPNGALSYLEWIFEFKNDARGQAEARCEILLPPNAAVSRLTLWVNGEEREAAFAGKSQVRQAYEQVVVQRRDPVLVTSAGRDAILMQCFPVPPNGGLMKVRLGITVPLQLDGEKNGILRWPIVREQNFAFAEGLEHTFWLDSPKEIVALGSPLSVEKTPSGHFMAHGNFTGNDQTIVQPAVLLRRDGIPDVVWTEDTRAHDGSWIVQTIQQTASLNTRDVVLVLDGSAATQNALSALKRVTVPRPLQIVIAGDTPRDITVRNSEDWSRLLNETKFLGGQDNVRALERGWDLAAAHGGGVLIWVHGAQPVLLGPVEGLKQRFERRRGAVQLLDLQIERGPNVLLPQLPPVARWESVSMHAPLDQTLSRTLLELGEQSPKYAALRRKVTSAPTGVQSNLHLARAWAAEEITRLARDGDREAAVNLASTYQLVSEVSGAVVLENAEQFKAAGLRPVDASTVPVVPEPSTWILLLTGSALFLWRGQRTPRSRQSRC